MSINTLYDHQHDELIEKAIGYLVKNIHETGHNPKPVILHSIRAGMILLQYGYSSDIVVATLLHDLLEDTEVIFDELQLEFGEKIANIVLANSFDTSIENKEAQFKDTFKRCIDFGKEALLVKSADIFDNLSFFIYAKKNIEGRIRNDEYLVSKISYFIDISKNILEGDTIFDMLVERFNHYKYILQSVSYN